MNTVIRHFTLGDIFHIVSQHSGVSEVLASQIMDGFVLKSRPPRPYNPYDAPASFDLATEMKTEGTSADETMTRLYTEDQIVAAMSSWGLGSETQGHILNKLVENGAHSSLMGKGLADKLGVTRFDNSSYVDTTEDHMLRSSDIRQALRDAAISNESINEILNNAEEIKQLRINVERMPVEEIPFHFKGKRMRLASADKPVWRIFTDMKTFVDEHGNKKAILVMDGEAYICDGDVPVDVDKRKVESD